jgi:rfaE bifunctional protein nucleotidyltransferase chain/domain
MRRATVLVADYGRGVTAVGSLRDGLATARKVVWDPHPRGSEPIESCALITPNRREAGLAQTAGVAEVSARARELAREWRARAVAVTLGSGGALLASVLGVPLAIPAPHVAVGDPCGAGDCFAATAAGMIADGATTAEAVSVAVAAASSFVASGGAAALGLTSATELVAPMAAGIEHAHRVIADTRAKGGRVVATGGCFDVLHAGHVASLRSARALGGCLIVCLNSDVSVRRLKGQSRPLVSELDRAEVLGALSFVDAVVIFDEDTPEAVLRELRPDVFVKGGDYEIAELPEARLVRSWGGEAVLVPYVAGYSTTRLIEEMHRRAG